MTFATLLLAAHPTAAAAQAIEHHHHHHPFGAFLWAAAGVLFLALLLRAFVRRRRFAHGPRRLIHHLFRRLDTSPSQEKEIRAAVDELRAQAAALRGEGRAVREGLGRSVAGDVFDVTAVQAAFASPEAKLPELRDAVTRALARIHEVLTPSQRTELAALISAGPGALFFRARRGC